METTNKGMETKRNCVQACDYCKLKKRKCVKEGERCTYCVTNGQECTYRNLNRKRGRMGERKKKKSNNKGYQDYVYPLHYQEMVNLDLMMNLDMMNRNLDNNQSHLNTQHNLNNMGLPMISDETQPSSPHNILLSPPEQYISLNFGEGFNSNEAIPELYSHFDQPLSSQLDHPSIESDIDYKLTARPPLLQPFLDIFHSVPNQFITSMVSREQLEQMANSTPTPTSLLLLYTMAALAGICHPTAHDRTSGMEWYFMAVEQLKSLQRYEFPCQISQEQFNTAAFLLDFIKVA